jgi:hypothetical protein
MVKSGLEVGTWKYYHLFVSSPIDQNIQILIVFSFLRNRQLNILSQE